MAVAATLLLESLFIKEERLMLGGVGAKTQIATVSTAPENGFNFSIGGPIGNAPAGGSAVGSATGGSIGAVTVDIQYTAVSSWALVTGMPMTQGTVPYTTTTQGQSLPQAADLSVAFTAGTTNSVTFTPPDQTQFNFPILGWVVYAGTAGQTGAHYVVGFTTGQPLVIASVPTTGQQPPTSDQSYATVTGGTGSAVEGSFNGIIPWLYGAGTDATLKNFAGKPTLLGYQDQFVTAFNNYFANPDLFLMNASDLNYLTNLLTGANGGNPYWFAANQGAAQADMVAGFRVARFLNPATSTIMPVDVHAYLPQGTALALSSVLPAWFPGNNVPSTWVWGGSMDYLEIDYQPTPDYVKYASDIMCMGAIHCFMPSQNILFTGMATA